jgi:7-carboxy-7-deazaguanine synthase
MKNNISGSRDELTLKINEIYYSLQGESTHIGRPCVFIRLAYCNLRCSYCDTEHAFYEGENLSLSDIENKVKEYNCKLVEITGGEPLIQKNVLQLMKNLCDAGYEVLLETAGHLDISLVDERVKRIMDIKCPSSGEAEKTYWANIESLKRDDEVKFVVGSMDDLDYTKEIIEKYKLGQQCPVIISPVYGKINNEKIARWILDTHLPVRMQIQLHKVIWEPDTRGV